MDTKAAFEEFHGWWFAPEQSELRLGCAEGWGFRIWLASRAEQVNPPVIPDGWRLFPIEPTQEMVDACFEATSAGGIQKGYRAMLAAAPKPESD